jgi:hypothetical protein
MRSAEFNIITLIPGFLYIELWKIRLKNTASSSKKQIPSGFGQNDEIRKKDVAAIV